MIFVIVMAYLSLDAIINWVPRSLGSSTPDPKSQAKIHSRERKRERERERESEGSTAWACTDCGSFGAKDCSITLLFSMFLGLYLELHSTFQ